MFKYYWRTGLNSFYKLQRGAIMVFFAILLPLLFGFMGLSLDVGLAYVEHGKVQDIADSAALAGAAHLSDSNRDDAIKAAVKAYVEANGITLQDGDLLKKESTSWETKESVPAGRQAVVAYGVVAVNNSEGTPVNRVRVRITKRVPVVFMSIVDGIADSFTVSAKAAAEGGGEETAGVVQGENPVFMCRVFGYDYLNANQIVFPGNGDFSVYMKNSNCNLGMLPGSGIVYSNDISGNGVKFGYDFELKEIYFDPPLPNNRYWISTSNGNTAVTSGEFRNYPPGGSDGETQKLSEKQDKHNELLALQKEINDKYDAFCDEGRETIKSVENNLNDFKGNVGNKRFIGVDNNGKVINTIQPGDDNIELYVAHTPDLYYHNNYYYPGSPFGEKPPEGLKESEGSVTDQLKVNVLTNFALKGVKSISKLYMSSGKPSVLNTYGIKYGEVYLANTLNDIIGGNNTFGTVYCVNKYANKDWGDTQLWIGGDNNHHAGIEGKPAFISDNNLYFGKVHRGVYCEEIDAPDGSKKQIVQANLTPGVWGQDPNWKLYMDMVSTPSGSGENTGTEGKITTGKLRLVE